MTNLFSRLQPPQKFRINISDIAKLLRIPKRLIVRVECWAYIVFIHRLDKGGQFISYRKLKQWQNAVACQIQSCTSCQQLRQLWTAIANDTKNTANNMKRDITPLFVRFGSKFGMLKNSLILRLILHDYDRNFE